ncbi:methyl-accepting chemotaxis protein [Pelosinus fermentans]|uniref:Methyl-accepting chemotaxis sensory transducer with Cache sensor n=1 Tax=Pelosinus fermentans JBW45 TaxID=1192197 RepID=I8TRJ5_9FIRM|nr:methyl-accepting chemotaxis protein [Pelosinus fermentans]AJQ25538.1 methyl-accepting chemotaxis sensory transducer with Cache sensor [Pelosinus fermentans JBW45]
MLNLQTIIGGGLNLKKKLIIFFVLIAAVPLILTTMVTSYLSQSALIESVYDDNEKVARSLSEDLNVSLAFNIELLQAMADTAEIQSMDPVKQLPIMKKIEERSKGISTIIVNDTKGIHKVRTQGALASNWDREYFQKILKGADYAISDIQIGNSTGKAALVIAVPIKDAQKSVIGALLGVIDFDNLTRNILATKSGQTGYAFLVDRQGKVIVHPDQALMKDMADVSHLSPVQEALSGKSGTISYDMQEGKILAGYSNVVLSNWGVVVQQPMDEAMAGASKVKVTGIIFTLIAILLAVLVGVFVAGVITRPIRELVGVTSKLAKGDLTAIANVSTQDEMGQLSLAFNMMAKDLQQLIRGVINNADQVAASSQELSSTANEAERATNQVAVTMTDFAQGSQRQMEEIENTLRVVGDLTQGSKGVADKAMSAFTLSDDMAKDAERGRKAAHNAVEKIKEIKEVTSLTSGVITGLGEKSKQIRQIVDVISGIAGQTNLLALNAAIEAARAGEQGRGFAVVAEEVRKLAEQSQRATEQIAQIVGEIMQQTDKAIQAMDSGNNKVNEGVDVVQTAGQALQDIMEQISKSVSMVRDINTDSKQQLQGMQHMISSTEQVAVIAKEASAGAQTTAAATEEVTASMEEIASAAEALAKTASELQMMVSNFKIQ